MPGEERVTMRGKLERTKAAIIITGIVMVVLGVAIMINPINAVQALVRIIGVILLAYGAVTLVPAFMRGDPVHNAPADLVMGGISAVCGLVMAIFPGALVNVVWSIIGVIVLLTGVLDITEAGALRRLGSPLALPATTSGIITAALGVITILMPMASMTMAMLVAAVALLIDGVTEIIFGLGM